MIRLAASLLLLGAACAHAPPKEVVWPPPPDKARIRFVTAFHDSDDLDPGGWTKVRQMLFGHRSGEGMTQPISAAISDDGKRLYVADFSGGTVFRADLGERKLSPFAREELRGRPFGVALDAEENVYVTESTGPSVVVLSKAGQMLRRFGAAEHLERPTGIAIDRARRLVYVVDTASQASQNHRVLAYGLDGTLHHRVGGAAAGSPSRGEGDGQFQFPVYAAVRSDGLLFVGDAMNFRIQVFDAEGRFLQKFGEAGDVPGTFSRIKGLAFDRFDNLYVADGDHSAVQMFNKRFETLMYFGGFSGAVADFDVPAGIAIHAPTDRIYVCNEHRGRMNVYELFNTSAEDSLSGSR